MTKWARLTVNLDPPLAAAAQKQAKQDRRSFSAYVATLIERDVAKTLAESPAPYTASEPQAEPLPSKIEEAKKAVKDHAAAYAHRARKTHPPK